MMTLRSIAFLFCVVGMIRSVVASQRLFFSAGNDSESVVRVSPGQNAVIVCQAGGVPSPVIYWLHNGVRIAQAATAGDDDFEDKYFENEFNSVERPALKLSSTVSRLYIDCATEEKAGNYECVAETPNKQISKTFVLKIQSDETGISHHTGCLKRITTSPVSVPARVYMWTGQRLEFEGTTVQLFCRAEGQPTPTVYWMDRERNPIQENTHKYKVLDSGDLLIFNVNWSTDMGQYLCVAKNNIGQDVVDIFLYPTRP